ncbi:hypothetical protein ACSVHC_16030 [Arthrobacter sp. KNU-44]|uniref:hypothetical protein n=1 Tax=unclassified Arthrobacter TaxID=235627 RepID=UPI003F434C33
MTLIPTPVPQPGMIPGIPDLVLVPLITVQGVLAGAVVAVAGHLLLAYAARQNRSWKAVWPKNGSVRKAAELESQFSQVITRRSVGECFESNLIEADNVFNVTIVGGAEHCPTCGGPAQTMQGTFDMENGAIEMLSGPDWTRAMLASIRDSVAEAKAAVQRAGADTVGDREGLHVCSRGREYTARSVAGYPNPTGPLTGADPEGGPEKPP